MTHMYTHGKGLIKYLFSEIYIQVHVSCFSKKDFYWKTTKTLQKLFLLFLRKSKSLNKPVYIYIFLLSPCLIKRNNLSHIQVISQYIPGHSEGFSDRGDES